MNIQNNICLEFRDNYSLEKQWYISSIIYRNHKEANREGSRYLFLPLNKFSDKRTIPDITITRASHIGG